MRVRASINLYSVCKYVHPVLRTTALHAHCGGSIFSVGRQRPLAPRNCMHRPPGQPWGGGKTEEGALFCLFFLSRFLIGSPLSISIPEWNEDEKLDQTFFGGCKKAREPPTPPLSCRPGFVMLENATLACRGWVGGKKKKKKEASKTKKIELLRKTYLTAEGGG